VAWSIAPCYLWRVVSAAPPAPPTVWSYLLRYRGRIAAGVAMLLATNLLYVGVPVTMGMAVEALRQGQELDTVPRLAILMIGFAIATAITRILSRVWIFNAARAAEYDLRSDLFGHLLRLEPAYYRDHPTGDVMSRLTNDVQTVRAMWGAGVLNLVNTVFAFGSVLVMMLRIDPWLTLWAVLPYPTILAVGQIMGKRIYRTSREVQTQLGQMSAKLQEDLGGIHLIKNYGLEDVRRDQFRAASLKLLDANMAITRVRGQLVPLLGALAAIGSVIVIWAGGNAVIRNDVNVGQLVEMLAYVARLVWPTLALGWMLSLLQRGKASWSRLAQLFETRTKLDDGDGELEPLEGEVGKLEIKHLTIAIDGRALLDDVTLTMPPGTVTAIVGRTGSGKSTLVDALCRMIDVPKGTIFLDGCDITALPLATLRGSIGYAPQDAFLFSTTIADNVAMGYGSGRALPRARADELGALGAATSREQDDPLAGGTVDPRVGRAAEAAGLVRDLAVMPEGFGTVVGERGITLSGGQRQRVALARAIAADRKVLVLDDSLSSVDAETERVILGHLREVMRGRTSILISHRVAAVKRADQIVVLDAGVVVERGTHAQLLAAGGVYADLYRTQLDPDELIARRSGPLPGIDEATT
jgi:ATP-binding cassette subfamily B multidrug efflux pump